MATWAERFDQYRTQEIARQRAENERNMLAEILRGAYEPGQAAVPATPDRPYSESDVGSGVGPLTIGTPIPGTGTPEIPGRPGGFNMQNAIARMAQTRFAPEALKLASEYDTNALRHKQLGKKASAVEVYEYWKNLGSPQEQEAMLRTMRGAQYRDIGGVPSEMPTLPGASVRPLTTLAQEAGGQAAIAAEKEAATTGAKARAEAGIALPGSEKVAETTERYIDELKTHPGKKWSLGAMSTIPTQLTPGTSRVDFKARLDQLKGGAFLEARQLLKGGGQITDFEGKRAEAAMARLETAQSEDAFDSALEDFRTAVRDGVSKLRQKATGGQIPTNINLKPGTIEDGYIFLGGDPKDKTRWKKK